MASGFYAAWAFVVMLAVVLPIAMPYAIWPSSEGVQADQPAACEQRARIDARNYTHPGASLWALSASVEWCERSSAGVLFYSAEVTAHGPYGIPFASSSQVTSQGGDALKIDGSGAALGFLALVGGIALASAPFVYLRLRHVFRDRPSLAVG